MGWLDKTFKDIVKSPLGKAAIMGGLAEKLELRHLEKALLQREREEWECFPTSGRNH
jgi:hypothetical protein